MYDFLPSDLKDLRLYDKLSLSNGSGLLSMSLYFIRFVLGVVSKSLKASSSTIT